MENKIIQVGDIVRVYWESCPILLRAKVIGMPVGEGDCWTLLDKSTGRPVNVQMFCRMDFLEREGGAY